MNFRTIFRLTSDRLRGFPRNRDSPRPHVSLLPAAADCDGLDLPQGSAWRRGKCEHLRFGLAGGLRPWCQAAGSMLSNAMYLKYLRTRVLGNRRASTPGSPVVKNLVR